MARREDYSDFKKMIPVISAATRAVFITGIILKSLESFL